MLEAALRSKLQSIFGFDKVTFNAPSDSREQNCLFVEVESCNSAIKKDKEIFRVSGVLTVFSSTEKIPFGFFMRRIETAKLEHTAGFFFHTVDDNKPLYVDLVERKCSFVFLHSQDVDSGVGEMTSIQTSEVSS